MKFGPINDEVVTAMRTLQAELTSTLILAVPYAERLLTIDTTVCSVQVGCILLQDRPKLTKEPVSYWSRSLPKAE